MLPEQQPDVNRQLEESQIFNINDTSESNYNQSSAYYASGIPKTTTQSNPNLSNQLHRINQAPATKIVQLDSSHGYYATNNEARLRDNLTGGQSHFETAFSNAFVNSGLLSTSTFNECESHALPGATSPIINCSTQNIYERMNFCPEELNFGDIEEVWIRKGWVEILSRVAFVAPIVLLGIIGNLIIIYSMYKFKPFRTKPTNMFVLNMAIADLLTTIVCPNAALFTDIYQFYVLGSFICRFEGFVKITCLLVSSYTLIVLSSDWLLCVVKPCRTRITIEQSRLALATIWFTAVIMASPLFVWRRLRERQWKDLSEVWCCELIEYTKYYWVVITFFLIYLPIFFMTIVLVIILLQMDKFEAKLKRSRSNSITSNTSLSINMKYRRRIVKILFMYLLTSIICWTPLQFTIIYRHFRSEAIPSPWFFQLAFYSQLSASLSAAMNPIIFGFLSQPFRKVVAKSFMFRFLDKIIISNTRNTGDAIVMNKLNLNHNKNQNNDQTHNHNNSNKNQSRTQNNSHGHKISNCNNNNHITNVHVNLSVEMANLPSNYSQQHNPNQSGSKRVSFNTSTTMSPNIRDRLVVGGCDNAGYEPIEKWPQR